MRTRCLAATTAALLNILTLAIPVHSQVPAWTSALGRALAHHIEMERGQDRSHATVVELGSSCESAFRGMVSCGELSPLARDVVSELVASVGVEANALSAARSRAASGTIHRELPSACHDKTRSVPILVVDREVGDARSASITYKLLATEPGTDCRVAGGAMVRVTFARSGENYIVVRREVLEYY